MQNLKKLAGQRDAWFIHQAVPMSIFKEQPETSREPTPEELRLLADLSWQNGLKGVVWWGMVQNSLLPQHAEKFTRPEPQYNGFRKEFVPDENFKAALRSINQNPSTGSTPSNPIGSRTVSSTQSQSIAQRPNFVGMRTSNNPITTQNAEDTKTGKYDEVITEIMYGIDDLQSALQKAIDAGLIVRITSEDPLIIYIMEIDNFDILLTIVKQNVLRVPPNSISAQLSCKDGTTPINMINGKPHALTKPQNLIAINCDGFDELPHSQCAQIRNNLLSAVSELNAFTSSISDKIPTFSVSPLPSSEVNEDILVRKDNWINDPGALMSTTLVRRGDVSAIEGLALSWLLGGYGVMTINKEIFEQYDNANMQAIMKHELLHTLGLGDDYLDPNSPVYYIYQPAFNPVPLNDNIANALKHIYDDEVKQFKQSDCVPKTFRSTIDRPSLSALTLRGNAFMTGYGMIYFKQPTPPLLSQTCNVNRLKSACQGLSTTTTSCTPNENLCECTCRTSCDLIELNKRCQAESTQRSENCGLDAFNCGCACGGVGRILPGRPGMPQEQLTGRDYFTIWNNGFWARIIAPSLGNAPSVSTSTTFICYWNYATGQCQAF